MEPCRILTFKAFRPHFNALARVGYYKLFVGNPSRTQLTLHLYYRVFIWLFVVSYNLQHVIKVVQTRDNIDEMVDTLCILLTTLNTLGKQLAFNARVDRMDRLIKVINGSHFAPKNPEHLKIVRSNEKAMARLLYLFQAMVITGCILLAIYPMVDRAMGREVHIIAYFPFDTSQSPVFEIVVWYLSFNLSFQACGNGTMDCTIAAFYAMAKTQLQMLRYNLEHLLDTEKEPTEASLNKTRGLKRAHFMDSDLIQERLKHCVQHHLQILWFVKEVESIFCEAMFFQFLVMSWVLCMTVYKIVSLGFASPEFWPMFVYLSCMLSQLFIYCYFGTQVKVESEFVAQSLYCSGWTSLSPAFRRQLLVMMQCTARPIVPCAAKVVPISLETYISVLRAAYTLFTILDKK